MAINEESGTRVPLQVLPKRTKRPATTNGKSKSAKLKRKSAPGARRAATRKAVSPRPPSASISKRATTFAITLLEFQKITAGTCFALVTRFQEETEKTVNRKLSKVDWMPKEGAKLVEAWMRSAKNLTAESGSMVGNTFELARILLERKGDSGK